MCGEYCHCADCEAEKLPALAAELDAANGEIAAVETLIDLCHGFASLTKDLAGIGPLRFQPRPVDTAVATAA